MRYVCLMFIIFAQDVYAFNWQDLWATADQKAQQLMQQGKFKEAEKQFRRSDWQAVAAYRDGQYEKSAQIFSQNGQDNYNRGNALARAGHYQEAIKAYDEALRLNPHDKDAQYNRKLVVDLLKKSANKQQKNQDQQQKQDKKDQQNQNQNQNQNQKNEKNEKNKDDQNQQDKQQSSSTKDEDKSENQLNNTQDKKDPQPDPNKKMNEQNKKESTQQKDKSQDLKNNDKNDTTSTTAEREKEQARQQWLRLVPDDPAGLLRQKLLRDHLRRQQGFGYE